MVRTSLCYQVPKPSVTLCPQSAYSVLSALWYASNQPADMERPARAPDPQNYGTSAPSTVSTPGGGVKVNWRSLNSRFSFQPANRNSVVA
jgi:hypothetical protein